MSKNYWQHFRHEADMGIRGVGETPAESFEQAGLALTSVMTDLDQVQPKQMLEIVCDAPTLDLLFYDWINCLVYETSTREMLFSKFTVEIQGTHLQATVWGEPVEVKRHQPAVEIKGATFTQLKVEQDKEHWVSQCVVDV